MADTSEASRRYWEAMNNSVPMQAINQLLLPFRVARKGLGMGEDTLANIAASVIGAKRPNPEARSMAQDQDLDKSFKSWEDSLSDIRNRASAGLSGARKGIMGALGWGEAGPRQPRDMTQTDPMPGPAVTRFSPDMGPAEGGALDMGVGFGGNTRRMLGLEGPERQAPGGALSTKATVRRAPAGGPAPAAAAAPPAEPAFKPTALAEQYQKRRGAIPTKVDRRLTQQDKGRALMQLGLAMMTAGSRPGSSFLGALGEGGQRGLESVRTAEERNRKQDAAELARKTEALNQEFNLRGSDEGRKLQAAQLEETRRGRMATEQNARRRIDLLARQLQQGATQVLETPNGYVLFDKSSRRATPLVDKDGKAIVSGKDPRPAEVQVLEYLQKHPEAAELYTRIKGKGAITPKDVLTQAANITGKQVALAPPDADTGDMLRKNMEAVRGAVGVPGALPQLPPGIPPGSKQIGTKNGKPVYQTPKGEKLIVE